MQPLCVLLLVSFLLPQNGRLAAQQISENEYSAMSVCGQVCVPASAPSDHRGDEGSYDEGLYEVTHVLDLQLANKSGVCQIEGSIAGTQGVQPKLDQHQTGQVLVRGSFDFVCRLDTVSITKRRLPHSIGIEDNDLEDVTDEENVELKIGCSTEDSTETKNICWSS